LEGREMDLDQMMHDSGMTDWFNSNDESFTGLKSAASKLASLVAAAERERCANLVLDDEYACTFQSMGKYRTEIAKSLRMPAN